MGKRYKRQETVAEFKARLSAQAKARGEQPVKTHAALLRPKGSQPTPSEVMGGAKLRKLPKPPKDVAKWLRANGVKL